MPMLSCPAPLQTQALQTLGSLVSDSFTNLLKIPLESRTQETVNYHKYVKELLHTKVPQVLLNSVVYHIFSRLANCRSVDENFVKNRSKCFAFYDFLLSVLDRKITKLKIDWQWNYIGIFTIKSIGHLTELKELKVNDTACISSDKPDRNEVGIFRNFRLLEHMTLHGLCSNLILEALSENCGMLKYLDVSGSIYVSDGSILFIRRFQNLLALDITDTSFSEHGRSHLLLELSQYKTLEKYSCTSCSNAEIQLLSQRFPAFKSLSVRLACLTDSVQSSVVRIVITMQQSNDLSTKIISSLGKNLVELKLYKCLKINISELHEHCPKLEKLTLTVNDIEAGNQTDHNLVGLRKLTLETEDSVGALNFLVHCPNLVTLKLITTTEFYETNLQNLLSLNPLGQLRKLTVGKIFELVAPRQFSLEVLQLLAQQLDLLSFKVLADNSLKEMPGIQSDANLNFKLNARDYIASRRSSVFRRKSYSPDLITID